MTLPEKTQRARQLPRRRERQRECLVDLIIDEVGYLQLDQTQANLFFQVISQRYDNNSAIIVTSNKGFSDWAEVFAGDAVMASAKLDRLLHRCTII